MKEKVKKTIKYLYTNMSSKEMGILPGHLAFYLLLMLIPFLTLMGSLLTTIDIGTSSITDIIYNNLPKNIANLIISISEQESSNISLWMLLIPTLILASNGTYSMITASNSIYKIENSSYIKNRLKAFVMLVVLVLIFVFLLLVPTFGNILFKIIGSILIDENIVENIWYWLFTILKYPVTFLFVFLSVKLLYKMAISLRKTHKKVTIGALSTSIMWVIATIGYSYYIEYFSSYETFYGGISSLLFLMLWIYLISYIFVFGIVLNASIYANEEVKSTR